MTMERWRPSWGLMPGRTLRGLEEMERGMESMFGSFFPAMWRRLPAEERGWSPPMEMYEKEDRFVVKLDLPGMRKEDIDISVVGDALIIKGERKAESEIKDEDYYCCERSYGSFYRSLDMPTAVESKQIEANYRDGILEVTLPKAAEVKPKKIEIGSKS